MEMFEFEYFKLTFNWDLLNLILPADFDKNNMNICFWLLFCNAFQKKLREHFLRTRVVATV